MDVQVLIKGDTAPAYIDASLSTKDGWRGGQWVVYTSNTYGNEKNIRVVGLSDGNKAVGFILRGSNFHPNAQTPGGPDLRVSEYNYSSYAPLNSKIVTIAFDGSYIFKMYEKYAFPNRSSGTELTYNLSDSLYLSDRGLFTTFADAQNAGIANPVMVGFCWMIPSEDNNYSIGVDIER